MRVQGVTRDDMAERMGASRVQLDRLLGSDNREVQLATLAQAVSVMGKKCA